jgi:transposase
MKHSTHTPAVSTTRAIGLDLGDQTSHYCVLDREGREIEFKKVATTRKALKALFERFRDARLICEVGTHSAWVEEVANELGMEVVLANPRKFELLTKSIRKTDGRDCYLLAETGRTSPGLLSPIKHRSNTARTDLVMLRARVNLVEQRTALVNSVRGYLKSAGLRAASCSPECFHKKVLEAIPPELEHALLPMVRLIEATTKEIQILEGKIEQMAKERYQVTDIFKDISGVGSVISTTFALTIDDPSRFAHARDVGPYMGSVPKVKSSGDSDPQLSITKAGDNELRRLMVIAANFILGPFGPDCDLRRFGMRVMNNGKQGGKNGRKRAKVAVARKLAVLMLHLWKTGQVYDPFYLARKRGETVPA